MKYLVRALDGQQAVRSLVLEAEDEQAVNAMLASQALLRLSISPANGGLRWLAPAPRQRLDAVLFAEELLALVSAGLSVVESLDTMIERSAGATHDTLLKALRERLREGQRLSQALQAHAGGFPPLLIGLVQAAESTSNLPQALERFLQYERQLRSLGQRIASASVYPMILMVVGGLVALFLLGHVVPKFAAVYQGSQQELPWASKWLLAWGQWVGNNQVIVGGFVLAGLCLLALRMVPIVRRGQWWELLRWVPGARPRLALLDKSRMYLTLGMLLESGLPISKAMQLAASVVPESLRTAWADARNLVIQGQALTLAFEQTGLSTPVAVRLMQVGERSGQIGPMLNKVAAFHENEASRWIERFSKTFEPVLMAVIGLVIGLIVILLYIPVFELAGSLQ